MKNGIARLGLLCPIGGGEYEYHAFAEAVDYRVRPYMVVAPHAGGDDDHDPEALKKTGDIATLERTAQALVPLKPDVGVWACTSGSFILGRDYAERQLDGIAKVLGVPATSTSVAFARAAAHLAVKRVAVLASYPEPAARAFVAFLKEFGLDVVRLEWLDARGGRDAFLMPLDTFAKAARKTNGPDIDAILMPDTAVAAFALIEPLEEKLKKPFLTANQVTVWDALRLAGWREPVPGYGRLFHSFRSA
ncbi:MAG: maleate cis-trans isomerase [Alphaproteobacteria bacterium]